MEKTNSEYTISSNSKILSVLTLVQIATALPFALLSLLVDQITASLSLPISQTGIFFGIAGLGAAIGWASGAYLLKYFTRSVLFILLLFLESLALLIISFSSYWLTSLLAFFLLGFSQCGALSSAFSVAIDLNPIRSAANISLIMSSNITIPLFTWGTVYLLNHNISWREIMLIMIIPLWLSSICIFSLNLPKHKKDLGKLSKSFIHFNDIIEFPRKLFFPFVLIFTGFAIGISIYGWAGILGERMLGGINNASSATGLILLGIGCGQLLLAGFLQNYSSRKLIIICSFLLIIINIFLLLNLNNSFLWILFLMLGLTGGAVLPLSISIVESQMLNSSHKSIGIIGIWGEGAGAFTYYLIGYLAIFIGGFVNSFVLIIIICSLLLLVTAIKVSCIKTLKIMKKK